MVIQLTEVVATSSKYVVTRAPQKVESPSIVDSEFGKKT